MCRRRISALPSQLYITNMHRTHRVFAYIQHIFIKDWLFQQTLFTHFGSWGQVITCFLVIFRSYSIRAALARARILIIAAPVSFYLGLIQPSHKIRFIRKEILDIHEDMVH